jgi:holin-like protein
MLLLLVLLMSRALKVEQIETTADFFLGNLPFFFVPAIVGLINYLDLLRDNAVKMLIVGMGTMVITFGVTVWTVRLTTALMERGKKK